MHELVLAEQVLAIAERARQQEQARRVLSIELEIGQLSMVEPEALRFAMDVLLPDSACCGARVHYRCIDGRARCRHCGVEFALDFLYDGCPVCASFDKHVLAGEGMLVTSISVE